MSEDRTADRTNDSSYEDDGRTIANMNVDGMPWYVPGDEERHDRAGAGAEKLSESQMRTYRWAAVKAGLLVVLVFGTVFGAFLAFCDFIWFR